MTDLIPVIYSLIAIATIVGGVGLFLLWKAFYERAGQYDIATGDGKEQS